MNNPESENKNLQIASVVLLLCLLVILTLITFFATKVAPVLFRIVQEQGVQLPLIVRGFYPVMTFATRYSLLVIYFLTFASSGLICVEALYKKHSRKILAYSIGMVFATCLLLFYCFLTILALMVMRNLQ